MALSSVVVLNSWIWLMFLPSCCRLATCAPTYNSKYLDVDKYLSTFGYLTGLPIKSNKNNEVVEIRKSSLRRFQKFNNLPETGVVDHSTYVMMKTPRCGVVDKPEDEDTIGTEGNIIKPLEFAVSGEKWKKRVITWGISKYTNQLTRREQISSFKAALASWEKESRLKFVYTEGFPDIDIRFVRGDHNDGSPFDGPSKNEQGTVLAHAFPPGSGTLSGDAHFDDDELWTVDIKAVHGNRKYLELVAAHEFGHSLGLQHSKVKGALMNPYYRFSEENYISYDDVYGLQSLYGAPPGWHPTIGAWAPTTAPTYPTCDTLFQAIVRGPDRHNWGILNDKAYLINVHTGTQNRSVALQDVFPGAPVGVDFAFTLPSGRVTYMFMGYNVWRFTGYHLDRDYPRSFHENTMPEQPRAIVATEEHHEEEILIFGDTMFWRLNTDNSVTSYVNSYNIKSYWSHSPGDYALVTTWTDGNVYLINKQSHVKLKKRRNLPGYPKGGVPDWILQSCPNSAGSNYFSVVCLTFTAFVMLNKNIPS